MPSTTEQLAAIAAALAEVDGYSAATPIRDAISESLRGRTFTLPRGVTLTTRDDGGVIYVENKTSRDWSTNSDRRSTTAITVYGEVVRGGKTSRGQVEIVHHYGDEDRTRAYWTSIVGGSVPDGARTAVASAVLAECDYTPEQWTELADEHDRATYAAKISGHIATAAHAIDDAITKLSNP